MNPKRQWEQPSTNTHYGRNLRYFIDDSPPKWGKGTKLSNEDPFPHRGFTALLIACVLKDLAAGKAVDEGIARYVCGAGIASRGENRMPLKEREL